MIADQVSEKRWYWLKVFALATIRDWDALEKFSKEKRPPIGNIFFNLVMRPCKLHLTLTFAKIWYVKMRLVIVKWYLYVVISFILQAEFFTWTLKAFHHLFIYTWWVKSNIVVYLKRMFTFVASFQLVAKYSSSLWCLVYTGYRPFVEACTDADEKGEALKYIPKLADPREKAEVILSGIC